MQQNLPIFSQGCNSDRMVKKHGALFRCLWPTRSGGPQNDFHSVNFNCSKNIFPHSGILNKHLPTRLKRGGLIIGREQGRGETEIERETYLDQNPDRLGRSTMPEKLSNISVSIVMLYLMAMITF